MPSLFRVSGTETSILMEKQVQFDVCIGIFANMIILNNCESRKESKGCEEPRQGVLPK